MFSAASPPQKIRRAAKKAVGGNRKKVATRLPTAGGKQTTAKVAPMTASYVGRAAHFMQHADRLRANVRPAFLDGTRD
jgi:hypothetical protein